MNICRCRETGPVLRDGKFYSLIGANAEQIDATPVSELYRCSVCGQHWRTDRAENIDERSFSKVNDAAGWRSAHRDVPLRMRQTVRYDEVTANFCLWGSCDNFRLRDHDYCIDHLMHI